MNANENPLTGLRTMLTQGRGGRQATYQAPLVEGRYRVTQLTPTTPFLFLPERESAVASILGGGRYHEATQAAVHVAVRRVLDLGAAEGAFANWAFVRWPNCWIDMVENDETNRELARRNAPPGAVLLDGGTLDLNVYQVIRIGAFDCARLIPMALEVADLVIVDFADSPTAAVRAERKEAARTAALAAWQAKLKEQRAEIAAKWSREDKHPYNSNHGDCAACEEPFR